MLQIINATAPEKYAYDFFGNYGERRDQALSSAMMSWRLTGQSNIEQTYQSVQVAVKAMEEAEISVDAMEAMQEALQAAKLSRPVAE